MGSKPNNGAGRKRSGCLVAVAVFIGIGLIGAVVGNLGSTQEESALDKAEKARADGDLATLSVAREAIRQAMKDPASAEFSSDFGRMKHGERVACGDVNGRNSFGAAVWTSRSCSP